MDSEYRSLVLGLWSLDLGFGLPRPKTQGPRPKSGFTLLEVILALSLTVVVLGLIGLSVKVQTGVAEKSRGQVEEAQLARGLVERIAEDIRNAVPFKPAPAASDSSGDGASSGSTSTSGTDSSGSTSASSSDSTASSTTPLSGGIFGTATALQVESIHRPKVDAKLVASLDDSGEAPQLSDVRNIAYSLGEPVTADMSQQPVSPTGNGLYRRDTERAEFAFGSQTGTQTDSSGGDSDGKLLAPEVTNLTFSYYDGSQFNDTWDSNQQGKLPTAIRVSVSIRSSGKAAVGQATSLEDGPHAIVYDTLVQLPNSNVGPGPVVTDGMPPISQITLDQPSKGGGGGKGGKGGRDGKDGKDHKPDDHKHKPTKPIVDPPPVKPPRVKPTIDPPVKPQPKSSAT